MSTPVIRCREVMTQHYRLVEGKHTVKEALTIVRQHPVHTLIVNKRHDDDEYGIVLLSDIAKKVLAANRSPERTNIYEIMAKPVISVSANMDIRYCARLFLRFGLNHAPVMENGEVLGVISYNDMVLKGCIPE
ncbi:MAG: CBS domain-containing protein [bacterium]